MKSRRKKLRLYILGMVFTLVTVMLWARLIQIQVFAHNYYKGKARKQWARTREVPPDRGAILDRKGRPLALCIRSYSISINPAEARKSSSKVVSLVSRITKVPERTVRKKLRAKNGFVWVKRRCALSQEEVKKLRSLQGVGIHVEADRTYPFSRVANKVVGFCGDDNQGMAGIEAAFNNELSGQPGWEKIVLDGKYQAHEFGKYPKKKPVNGKSIILTIDAAIQEIAEAELEKAVRANKARRGAVIIMDCTTGEILALAEYPSPRSRSFSSKYDSLWTMRSVSCVYEPGSTFKLVTAASLLESGALSPSDVFYAEKGKADLGFATISDAHSYGYLTFKEGFVLSSNIVMAKAALKLSSRDFYKFIRLFGFGTKTGIELMGESPGRVASVDEWSKRTQATMAFGHEIAVTPLQMLNAFAAVANDGILMVPTLVKAVVDENSSVVKRLPPVKKRNVISKNSARTLRAFCRDVVKEGTGTAAGIKLLQVAGKTGTGQKASGRGGYLPGKYVASFIGFLPYQNPKITALVLLDEPAFSRRFGSISAAPVFARLSQAIAYSTDLLDDMLVDDIMTIAKPGRSKTGAPNFLRMNVSAAMALAREKGLNVLCNSEEGRIISQDPDPGVLMDKDEVVRLFTSRSRGNPPGRVPDLMGLSMREAKRRVIEMGWSVSLRGSGTVVSQYPRPGESNRAGVIKLRCGD